MSDIDTAPRLKWFLQKRDIFPSQKNCEQIELAVLLLGAEGSGELR